MKRRCRQHRGYVLVVTLALLVLAATMLVSLGQTTMRRASEARQATEDLQRRWAIESCRKVLLPNAEKIIARAEAEQKEAMSAVRVQLNLSGQAIDVILSDEQAKANVNVLLEQAERSTAENRLQQALSGTGLIGQVRLRPLVNVTKKETMLAATRAATGPSTEPVLQAIQSFGQVFDQVRPETLVQPRGQSPAIAEMLTCWGSGAINVRRAPEAAMKLVAGTQWPASTIDGIISARQSQWKTGTGSNLSDVLKKALTRNGQGKQSTVAWTTDSKCYSAWIIAHTSNREYYELVVRDQRDPNGAIEHAFVW